jgi:hypothetical protein
VHSKQVAINQRWCMLQAANTLKHPQAQAAPSRGAPTASNGVFAAIVLQLLYKTTSRGPKMFLVR